MADANRSTEYFRTSQFINDHIKEDMPAARLSSACHRLGRNEYNHTEPKEDVPAERLSIAPHSWLGQYNAVNMSIEPKEDVPAERLSIAPHNWLGQYNAVSTSIEPKEDVPAERLSIAPHRLGQYNGVNMSIEVSDTFVFKTPEAMGRAFSGELGPDADIYIYSRCWNPTVRNLGDQLAAMEATETAYCTSSGKTTVLYFESVSNPTLIVADIPKLSKVAHDKGVKVVVDNTFLPMILSPATLGADVVVHSLTKYVSGGADLIAGAICGPADVVKPMMDLSKGPLMILGPTMNPKEAFELSGRLPHLSLRMKKHCNRALKLAQRMRDELNLKVIYPGLDDHPQHKLMKSMKNKGYGFGGVLAVDMKTTERANKLMEKLQNKYHFGFLAVSLGYYETLMSCSGSSTSSEMSKKEKKLAGISPGLVRISVGYLGTLDQKWNQFRAAYNELKN